MKTISIILVLLTASFSALSEEASPAAQAPEADLPKATIDGNGPGWRELWEQDFVHVNCAPETWSWKDGIIHCTGQPVGVIRSKNKVKNLELVVEWRHL